MRMKSEAELSVREKFIRRSVYYYPSRKGYVMKFLTATTVIGIGAAIAAAYILSSAVHAVWAGLAPLAAVLR